MTITKTEIFHAPKDGTHVAYRHTTADGDQVIGEIEDLDALLNVLIEGGPLDDSAPNAVGADALPTFGGDEPLDTHGVWSWDETRILHGGSSYPLCISNR